MGHLKMVGNGARRPCTQTVVTQIVYAVVATEHELHPVLLAVLRSMIMVADT